MPTLIRTFVPIFDRFVKRWHGFSFSAGRERVVLILGVFSLALPGCAGKRDGYDVPKIMLPTQYKNASSADTAPAGRDSSSSPEKPNAVRQPDLTEWWRSFGNAELVELIDRGLANNADLRIATLRLAQAKNRADQAQAGLAPTISAPLGAAIQMPGGSIGDVPVGEKDRHSQQSYQASLRGNFRVDVWGEQRSLAESARFQVWQSAFERDNVQRNMAANLAASYIELLSLNDRLRVAREIETVMGGMLAAMETRMEAGDATLVDLNQQKTSFHATRTVIPGLEQQREDLFASMAFLVGAVPGSLKFSSDSLDALHFPATVPALPSSLLLRRSDVRMAEARLLGADADIDVARARLLPPLDLSAQMGYSGLAISQLFQPSAFFWNALANFTVSIFDKGKRESEKENAQALHEEMVESYARTLYQAVREVESALVAIRTAGERLKAQQEVVASARRVWDSSARMYALGGVDYIGLLDSERAYHRYMDEYLRIKMDYYRGYINLFQALGGGVSDGEPLPGKGARPLKAQADAVGPDMAASDQEGTDKGVYWAAQPVDGDKDAARYWQVELPGLYHRSTLGATWRDLRARYPALMENRFVRPRLQGRIEDSNSDQMAWYRVYVGQFTTAESAQALCAALQGNNQRCRVVSSNSDETVVMPPHNEAQSATANPGAGALSAPAGVAVKLGQARVE